ncbi:MAG: hypothetical protein D6691_05110 [Candidatus Hydrogenedentota bacterium]|nr:MAG: hypothetical protein D6691_05110 [Candidatus Hydrogenedentota bacterium]
MGGSEYWQALGLRFQNGKAEPLKLCDKVEQRGQMIKDTAVRFADLFVNLDSPQQTSLAHRREKGVEKAVGLDDQHPAQVLVLGVALNELFKSIEHARQVLVWACGPYVEEKAVGNSVFLANAFDVRRIGGEKTVFANPAMNHEHFICHIRKECSHILLGRK